MHLWLLAGLLPPHRQAPPHRLNVDEDTIDATATEDADDDTTRITVNRKLRANVLPATATLLHGEATQSARAEETRQMRIRSLPTRISVGKRKKTVFTPQFTTGRSAKRFDAQ